MAARTGGRRVYVSNGIGRWRSAGQLNPKRAEQNAAATFYDGAALGKGNAIKESRCDSNNDGQVDGGDYGAWQSQYGDPPNIRGGNAGVVARFNPNTGNSYIMVMDDQNQWNLNVVDGPNSDVVGQINDGEGENLPLLDPVTRERLNARRDLIMQLDVTGEGANTLLGVWFGDPAAQCRPRPNFRNWIRMARTFLLEPVGLVPD